MPEQTQTSEDVVREFHSGIWSGDHELFDEYVSEDYVGHDPAVPEDIHGPDEFRAVIEERQSGLSDIEHTIHDLFGDGDRVVARGTVTARHTGDLMGIPPTDSELSVDETIVYRLDDGEIAETWAALDRLGLLQQLGAIEPPAN